MFRGPSVSANRPPTSVPKIAKAARAEKSCPTWGTAGSQFSLKNGSLVLCLYGFKFGMTDIVSCVYLSIQQISERDKKEVNSPLQTHHSKADDHEQFVTRLFSKLWYGTSFPNNIFDTTLTFLGMKLGQVHHARSTWWTGPILTTCWWSGPATPNFKPTASLRFPESYQSLNLFGSSW